MELMQVDAPLNSEEKYMYAINQKLDVIISLLQQMSVQESKIEKVEPKKKKR